MAVTLAARAALRVLPIIWRARKAGYEGNLAAGIILPVARATAAALAAGKYPAMAAEPADSASAAAFAAADSSAADSAAAAAFAADSAADSDSAFAAASAASASAFAAAYSSAASAYFAAAFNADVQAIEKGVSAQDLAARKLWPSNRPRDITALWTGMKKHLLAQKEDWEVWTDWYEARLKGQPAIEELEIARVMIADDIWQKGPKVVNAEIKRLMEDYSKTSTAVEPSPEPGPVMQMTSNGLEVIEQPLGGDFDQDIQKNLHARLQRLLPVLTSITHDISNAHPELDFVISEYGELIAQPFEKLDVASLWAVGSGVLAFRQAFANQANSTMTVPLEPAQFALLQQAAEIHGGFILGFPQGRALVERADQARLSPEIIVQIDLPTRRILQDLARSTHFVEQHARRFLAAIEEGLIVSGWETARAGHVGYVVTKNSLIGLGRVLNWANSSLSTVAGGLILSAIDPQLQFTQYIIQFVLDDMQSILSFIEPFPELRDWFGSIIKHIDKEKHPSKKS